MAHRPQIIVLFTSTFCARNYMVHLIDSHSTGAIGLARNCGVSLFAPLPSISSGGRARPGLLICLAPGTLMSDTARYARQGGASGHRTWLSWYHRHLTFLSMTDV